MQVNRRGEVTYPSYPLPKNYFILKKQWIKKNPWVKIGNEVQFPLQSKVLGTSTEIKNRSWINGPFTIKGSAKVTIGKYCAIAENLFIITSNHQLNSVDIQGTFTVTSDISKGPVYIGNNVWIGDNVTILPGVTIGDGAVIGAGSIVTRDILPFAVAVGVPARVVKYRFSKKIIKKLLNISWWHWENKTIDKNKLFFAKNINEKNIDSLTETLNLTEEIEVLEINLTKNNSTKWLLEGWGPKEENGRWVEKNSSGIIFKIINPNKYKTFSLYGYSYYMQQNMVIFVNGEKIGQLLIKSEWNIYSIPIKKIKKGVNTLNLIFKKSFSPSQVEKNSTDKRNLFCRFVWFKMS